MPTCIHLLEEHGIFLFSQVVNAIDWSKGLDHVFIDNYNRDPSLSWQYFGSSTGFMRQYPAIKWMTSDHDPDLYDARMREW